MTTTRTQRITWAGWTTRLAAIVIFVSPLSQAQVIQQPAFRNFSYSGSAWVPDGGMGSLAGATYARTNSLQRGGLPGQRQVGTNLGGSSLSASVQVIDLQALDEAILSAGSNAAPVVETPDPGTSPTQIGKRFRLNDRVSSNSELIHRDANAYRRAMYGHEAGIQLPASDSQVEADIRYYLSQGKLAEQAGRIQSARVYYRMAMEALTPEVIARYDKIMAARQEAAERLKEKNRPDRIQF